MQDLESALLLPANLAAIHKRFSDAGAAIKTEDLALFLLRGPLEGLRRGTGDRDLAASVLRLLGDLNIFSGLSTGNDDVTWADFVGFLLEAAVEGGRGSGGHGSELSSLRPPFRFAEVDVGTKSPISSVTFLPAPFNVFAVIEERSSSLKLYEPLNLSLVATVTATGKGIPSLLLSSSGSATEAALPGVVTAALRREKAAAADFVRETAPFVLSCLLLQEEGLLCVCQSNGMITLWTNAALTSYSSELKAKLEEEKRGGKREPPEGTAGTASAAVAGLYMTGSLPSSASLLAHYSPASSSMMSKGKRQRSRPFTAKASDPLGPPLLFAVESTSAARKKEAEKEGQGSHPFDGLEDEAGSGTGRATRGESFISVFDIEKRELLTRFKPEGHKGVITAIAVVPQHGVVITAAVGGTLSVHRLPEEKRQHEDEDDQQLHDKAAKSRGLRSHAMLIPLRSVRTAAATSPPAHPTTAATGRQREDREQSELSLDRALEALAATDSNLRALSPVRLPALTRHPPVLADIKTEKQEQEEHEEMEGDEEVTLTRQVSSSTLGPMPSIVSSLVTATAGTNLTGMPTPSEAATKSAPSCRFVGSLRGHSLTVRQICFVAASDLLVACGFGLDILAHDLSSMKLLLRLKGHCVPVVGVQELPSSSPLPPPSSSSSSASSVPFPAAARPKVLSLDASSSLRIWDVSPALNGLGVCLLSVDLKILSPTASLLFGGSGSGGRGNGSGSSGSGSSGGNSSAGGSALGDLNASAEGGSKVSLKALVKASAATAEASASAYSIVSNQELIPRSFSVSLLPLTQRGGGRLVVGGPRLSLYKAVPAEEPSETGNNRGGAIFGGRRLTAAVFSPFSSSLIVASGRDLRVFDARTGKLDKEWLGVAPSPISSLALDGDRSKRLLIGLRDGGARVLNATNGSVLRVLEAEDGGHQGEVSAVSFVPRALLSPFASSLSLSSSNDPSRCIVTAGRDRTILIAEEPVDASKATPSNLPPDVLALTTAASSAASGVRAASMALKQRARLEAVHLAEISALAVSHPKDLGLVASGGGDFLIKIHDLHAPLQRAPDVLEGCMGEISALQFSEDNHPILISADSSGGIVFWCVRPLWEGQVNRPCLSLKHLPHDHDSRGDLDLERARKAQQRLEQQQGGQAGELSSPSKRIGPPPPPAFSLLRDGTQADRCLAFGTPISAMLQAKLRRPSTSNHDDADGTTTSVLIVGDESGRIKIFNLSTALELAGVPKTDEVKRLASMRHKGKRASKAQAKDDGVAGAETTRALGLASNRADLLATLPQEVVFMAKTIAKRRRSLAAMDNVSPSKDGTASAAETARCLATRGHAVEAKDVGVKQVVKMAGDGSKTARTASSASASAAPSSRQWRPSRAPVVPLPVTITQTARSERRGLPANYGKEDSQPLHPANTFGRCRSLTVADMESVLLPSPSSSAKDANALVMSKRTRRASFASIAAIARATVAVVDATPQVPVLFQWKAHQDAVNSLQIVTLPSSSSSSSASSDGVVGPVLMSACVDGAVMLWDLGREAEPLGNLLASETLGVDPIEEQQKREEMAARLAKSAASKLAREKKRQKEALMGVVSVSEESRPGISKEEEEEQEAAKEAEAAAEATKKLPWRLPAAGNEVSSQIEEQLTRVVDRLHEEEASFALLSLQRGQTGRRLADSRSAAVGGTAAVGFGTRRASIMAAQSVASDAEPLTPSLPADDEEGFKAQEVGLRPGVSLTELLTPEEKSKAMAVSSITASTYWQGYRESRTRTNSRNRSLAIAASVSATVSQSSLSRPPLSQAKPRKEEPRNSSALPLVPQSQSQATSCSSLPTPLKKQLASLSSFFPASSRSDSDPQPAVPPSPSALHVPRLTPLSLHKLKAAASSATASSPDLLRSGNNPAPPSSRFVQQRREALKLLDALLHDNSGGGAGEAIDVTTIGDDSGVGLGDDDGDDEDRHASTRSGSSTGRSSTKKTSTSGGRRSSIVSLGDGRDVFEEIGAVDRLLETGIVEGPMKRKRGGSKGGKKAVSPNSLLRLSRSTAGLLSLEALTPDSLLGALSKSSRSTTLLTAHLARTGQKPLASTYKNLAAGTSTNPRSLSTASLQRAQQKGPTGQGRLSVSVSKSDVAPKIRFCQDSSVDVAPSAFLFAKLGSKKANPGLLSQTKIKSLPNSLQGAKATGSGSITARRLSFSDEMSAMPGSGGTGNMNRKTALDLRLSSVEGAAENQLSTTSLGKFKAPTLAGSQVVGKVGTVGTEDVDWTPSLHSLPTATSTEKSGAGSINTSRRADEGDVLAATALKGTGKRAPGAKVSLGLVQALITERDKREAEADQLGSPGAEEDEGRSTGRGTKRGGEYAL